MYALYQYFGASGTSVYVATNTQAPNTSVSVPTVQPINPTKKVTATVPVNNATTPTPVVVPPVKKNLYADGTYTGNVADAYYGNIQVQAVIQNGQITDVQFLQYPSDRSTSIRINGRAMPMLKSEAISAQSANVNIVSGATDSSQAFMQSLGSALTSARNS